MASFQIFAFKQIQYNKITMIKLLFIAMMLITLSFSANADKNQKLDDDSQVQQQFDEFLVKYDKSYSGQEYGLRKAAFAQTLKDIMAQRRLSPKTQFGITKFADWLPSEKQAYLNEKQDKPQGGLLQEKNKKPSQPKRNLQTVRNLQATYFTDDQDFTVSSTLDWRDSGKVSAPKDQGNCGSCWAFAGIGALEAALDVRENRKLDLSEQWALECTADSFNCQNGGITSTVLKNVQKGTILFYQGNAIQTEQDFPYKTQKGWYNASQICLESEQVKFSRDIDGVSVFYHPSDWIMERILTRSGPVAVSVNANLFWNYQAGPLDCSSLESTGTNHAVLVVGYTENSWIVKNSWGTDWGNGGYLEISKSANCNMNRAIELYFKKPIEQVDLSTYSTASYRFQLTDTYGDGWNGNEMAVRQGGVVIHTVGADFTNGNSLAPFNLDLYPDLPIQLVVHTLGGWSYECRAKVYDSNNNLVVQKSTNAYWDYVGQVLAKSIVNQVTYYADLYSTQVDKGYGGLQFGFLQGKEVVARVGKQFTSGTSDGPVEVKLEAGKETHLQVVALAEYTNYVGITLKDAEGNVIFDQQPGAYLFYSNVYQAFMA